MSNGDNDFWRELREATAEANLEATDLEALDPTNEAELAAAEALLQQFDEEDSTAEQHSKQQTTDQPIPLDAESARARSRNSGWHRAAKVAAATLLAPKLLLAATAATVVAVTAMLVQNTTQSLELEEAIQILMNQESPAEAREAAEGRVYFLCIESILLIQDSNDGQMVTTEATTALELIRTELHQPRPFSLASYSVRHEHLLAQLIDTAASVTERRESIQAVAEQAAYGVRALKAIAKSGGPGGLMASNAAHLKRIAQLLSN